MARTVSPSSPAAPLPAPAQRLGNVPAMVRLLRKIDGDAASAAPSASQPAPPEKTSRSPGAPPKPATPDTVLRKRRMLADLCRLIGAQIGAGEVARSLSADPSLSPRLQQTLERMLAGDSEKQIAARLELSRHTVHVYVKSLYRHFDVSSRGELLARFVRRSHSGPGLPATAPEP